MLIAEQITGLILAVLSVLFMLWFLAALIRESRTRYPRYAHPPVEETNSSQLWNPSPLVPGSSVPDPRNPGNGARRPVPQFAQSSRSLRIANR